MDQNCIFCDIIQKKIPAKIVHETEHVLAFHDIRPQAPVHILIIPKEHIPTLNDLKSKHQQVIGEIFLTAAKLAKELGFAQNGYRTIFNCNRDAGQDVYHIHLHLLAGRKLYWPPG